MTTTPKRKTVRGFDAAFRAAEQAHRDIVYTDPVTDEQWITYYRDLTAARVALAEVYAAALAVAPHGGIVWSALHEAHVSYEERARRSQKLLDQRIASVQDGVR